MTQRQGGLGLRPWLRTATVLTFAVFLTACSRGSEQKFAWTETVMLQDQGAITVERKAVFRPKSGTFPNVMEWYSIEFEHPATKERVYWRSKMFLSTEERQQGARQEIVPSLELFAILRSENRFFVMTRPHNTKYALNCPDPPFLLYEWTSGSWRKMPLESIPQRVFYLNVSEGSLKQLLALPRDKHVGVEVSWHGPGGNSPMRKIDLTRMTSQTADGSYCESWRPWTDSSKYFN